MWGRVDGCGCLVCVCVSSGANVLYVYESWETCSVAEFLLR